MGEHFYTVVLPRMKKVLYYDKSGVSKEDDVKQEYNDKRAGGFFKYFDLEQYEDSLNNIEFDASMSESKSLHNLSDYEIKYMLDYETGSSRIFLNVKLSEDPFFYKLKIINDGEEKTVNIDLPETFNYIYNVKVNKILSFDEKKYIFVLGKKDDENLLIVWRPLNNINYEEDRDLIYKIIDEYFNHVTIDTVLTNGNNIIDNGKVTNGGKSLDPIYNKLIFGGE
jgi:adenine-specific DNA-methyltransferase